MLRWAVRTAAGWLVLVSLALAILFFADSAGSPAFSRVLPQAALLGLLFFLVGSRPAVRAVFGALPVLTRRTLWAALLLCALAQLLQAIQASYPFMAWHMYTEVSAPANIRTHVYQEVDRAGSTGPFRPSREFPAIQGTLLEWRLDQLLKESPTSATADRILRFLAQRHNRRATGQPIQKIIIFIQRHEYDPVRGRFESTRELVRDVSIE